MNTKSLNVSNLSETTNEEKLKRFFRNVGRVEWVHLTKDQGDSAQARVIMASYEDAARAVSKLSGKDFEGRKLEIVAQAEARPVHHSTTPRNY